MKLPFCLVAFAVCGFLISSCKSTNLVSEESSIEQIGPNGGTITSADGTLTLTFPAGALSTTESIMIKKISIDDLGPEFEQIRTSYTIGSVYELSPDGLQFDTPVYAELISDQKAAIQNGRTELEAEILFSSRNGVLSVLENSGIWLNTESKVTVYGNLRGFSKLVQVKDVGYSVSTLTREDIEQTPEAGRTMNSIVSITPGFNLENNTGSIWQSYGSSLSFKGASDIESLEVVKGPQGTLYGTVRTFNYQCTNNGKGYLETRAGFTFPENEGGDILQNSPYEMSIEQVINCVLPEDSEEEEEYDFSISNIKATFDTTPGWVSLTFSYNISPEIAENSRFKVNWGDRNISTYEPTGPETTWAQTGPTDIYKYEDTQQFSVRHQYKLAGPFDISVEAWGYKEPKALNNVSPSSLDTALDIGTRWLLQGDKLMAEWDMNRGDSFDSIIEKNITKRISDRFTFGPEVNIVPRAPTVYTTDGHLQMKWNNYERFIETLPSAIPNFSVDKIDIFENLWIYKLNYPNEFTERFDLTPSFSYSEFPNEEGNQPLEFDLNLDQAMPIIIQLDELWNPVLIDDINLFDPNSPTRLITPTLFEQLQQQQKVFDFEETTVEVPGHTLRVFKDGDGSGRVLGIGVLETDHDQIDCGNKCAQDFTEGTDVRLAAFADLGSKFIGFSNNTISPSSLGSFANITVEEYTTVTATFMKKESEDSDLESPLPDRRTLDETGSIRGQVFDKDGAELPGAVVIVTNESGTENSTTVTNAEGRYRFLTLQKNIYTVTAEYEGFTCEQSGIENIVYLEDLEPGATIRNFEVNFKCINKDDEDASEEPIITSTAPLGDGPIVRDIGLRPGFWLEGGLPLRSEVIDFVEDQENIVDAEVTNISPTFGVGGVINLVTKRGNSTNPFLRFGYRRGSYDYRQLFNNGTEVNGDVRVNELFTGIGLSYAPESLKVRPYFKTGLNTVFNKSKIEIQNPFSTETENEERTHTGFNFLFGGGAEVPFTENLSLSLGANYNVGGADGRTLFSAGISYYFQ